MGNVASRVGFHTFHLVVVVTLEPKDGAPSVASLYGTGSLGAICRLEPGLIRSLPLLHPCNGASSSPRARSMYFGPGAGWGRGNAKGVTL